MTPDDAQIEAAVVAARKIADTNRLGRRLGPCLRGCGEMGSCHPNIGVEAETMARVILMLYDREVSA